MKTLLAFIFLSAATAAFAQDSADARQLFEEARQHLETGRIGAAKVAFQALIAVYPESSFVPQARDAVRAIESIEPKPAVVRSIRFEHFRKIKRDEILERLRQREVPLEIEGAFDARDLAEGREVVRELLIEKGYSHRTVRTETRAISPGRVAVVFRMVKG